jgi:hypothetical protein
MEPLTKKRYLLLDNAIHDHTKTNVIIDNQQLKIELSKNGESRFVTWEDKTFIQQDKKRNTQFGKLAREHQVTRIMRSGGKPWGLIIDGKIELE